MLDADIFGDIVVTMTDGALCLAQMFWETLNLLFEA